MRVRFDVSGNIANDVGQYLRTVESESGTAFNLKVESAQIVSTSEASRGSCTGRSVYSYRSEAVVEALLQVEDFGNSIKVSCEAVEGATFDCGG